MFQTLLTQPLYNGFIYLIGIMPGGEVGLAIIVLTIVIRIVFYPAFAASIRTQMGMQAAQAELDEINKQYKDKPEERAKHTMVLFKKYKVRPFAGFIALLVQIPIFIALYLAFFREGLPNINTPLLYSFVQTPALVNVHFFGFLDLLSPHNILLSLLVGLSQYAVTHFSFARNKPHANMSPEKQSMHKIQRSMMLYFLPGFIGIISYTLPSAVGLYFLTGNVFSLGQEWIIRRQMLKKANG